MSSAAIFQFLGGLGLFLLGMSLMSDGLKRLAGDTLKAWLEKGTANRTRSFTSGFLLTAVMQSSSVVTLTTIGFVSAGVLQFAPAMWVMFGSNVGTTMTGWLVALVGFKFKIEAFALPLIGLGMLLRLIGGETRKASLGLAMAGFGVLFLGMNFMQTPFATAGAQLDLSGLTGYGVASIAAFIVAGLVLTVLAQSSSASIAIILSLAQLQIIPLTEAAGAVMGANIGTTVTALLASLGATPNAKRAALSHLGFNAVAFAVALVLLPVMLWFIDWLLDSMDMIESPALILALFHTLFNLLGAIAIWPIAPHMARWLLARFNDDELKPETPVYLDNSTLQVPALAINAVHKEQQRLRQLCWAAARHRLDKQYQHPSAALQARQLLQAIFRFCNELSLLHLQAEQASQLGKALFSNRAAQALLDLLDDIELPTEPSDWLDQYHVRTWLGDVALALAQNQGAQLSSLSALIGQYDTVKSKLIHDASLGKLQAFALGEGLKQISLVHRAMLELIKLESNKDESPQRVLEATA